MKILVITSYIDFILLTIYLLTCFTNNHYIFNFRINYDVACPMNFKKYPYDTQLCKIKYESCKYKYFHNLISYLTILFALYSVIQPSTCALDS